MSNFIEPIVSEYVLKTLIEKTFTKSFSNIHTSIVCFRGAGIPATLRYLLKNYKSIASFPDDRLYLWLDLAKLNEDEHIAYKSSLISLGAFFNDLVSENVKKEFQQIGAKETLSLGDYMHALESLISKENKSLTLVLENFRKTFDDGVNCQKLSSIVSDLCKLDPNKISCVFIVDKEFDVSTLGKLGTVWSYVTGNILYGKDISYDEVSADLSFTNHSKWHNKSFSKDFVEVAKSLAAYDPTTLKHIIMCAVADKTFEEKLTETQDISSLYTLIGDTWLDERFKQIVINISGASLSVLKEGRLEEASEFLLNTGLVVKDIQGNLGIINPLFGYFLTTRLSNLNIETNAEKRGHPKDFLTGQEYLVFTELLNNTGEVVTKEALAEVIWGSAWEEKYSDWALDKLTSTIRKKLEEFDYPKTLKSIKGKGVMLA